MPNLEASYPLGNGVDEKEAQRRLRIELNRLSSELRKGDRAIALVSSPVFEWRDKNHAVLWARAVYKYGAS